MTSKGVKEGPKGSKKCQFPIGGGKIEPNRSLSEHGWSRPGRAEVEGVKTDPGRAKGGPSMTTNDYLWPKDYNVFYNVLDNILVTPATLNPGTALHCNTR